MLLIETLLNAQSCCYLEEHRQGKYWKGKGGEIENVKNTESQ